MIESLELDNFKSWRHVGPMRLAPLTGLFGTNSSGKTSLNLDFDGNTGIRLACSA